MGGWVGGWVRECVVLQGGFLLAFCLPGVVRHVLNLLQSTVQFWYSLGCFLIQWNSCMASKLVLECFQHIVLHRYGRPVDHYVPLVHVFGSRLTIFLCVHASTALANNT